MTIQGRPRKRHVLAPDGQPANGPTGEGTSRSKVSEVQDPVIAGDADKERITVIGEVAVDEAGQLKRKRRDVDLLH